MFQFEITGNVRNEQIILEDYNTQGGKKPKELLLLFPPKPVGNSRAFSI